MCPDLREGLQLCAVMFDGANRAIWCPNFTSSLVPCPARVDMIFRYLRSKFGITAHRQPDRHPFWFHSHDFRLYHFKSIVHEAKPTILLSYYQCLDTHKTQTYASSFCWSHLKTSQELKSTTTACGSRFRRHIQHHGFRGSSDTTLCRYCSSDGETAGDAFTEATSHQRDTRCCRSRGSGEISSSVAVYGAGTFARPSERGWRERPSGRGTVEYEKH